MNIIPSSPRNASPAIAGVALIYINMRLPGCAYLNRSAGSLRNVPAALAEAAALLQLGASVVGLSLGAEARAKPAPDREFVGLMKFLFTYFPQPSVRDTDHEQWDLAGRSDGSK